jgi:hypothetical protein
MPDLDTLFPGRFLKAAELPHPMTFTISAVGPELVDPKGKDKTVKKGSTMPVVKFAETSGRPDKEDHDWRINKTNALLVAEITGSRDYKTWPGHKVTLESQMVRFGKEKVPGVRVIGSPELARAITKEYPIGRERVTITLKPTGTSATATPTPDPDAVIDTDPPDGEVAEVTWEAPE